MIQRVQSIYLLMVVLLMSVLCFFSLFEFTGINSDGISIFNTIGIESGDTEIPTWGVVSIAALSAIIAFINIFLFKKRKLQIKLCHFTTFLLFFFYVTIAVYFYCYTKNHNIDIASLSFKPHVAILMPIIALIFNILAIIRIKKDEKLVRSLDRIR